MRESQVVLPVKSLQRNHSFFHLNREFPREELVGLPHVFFAVAEVEGRRDVALGVWRSEGGELLRCDFLLEGFGESGDLGAAWGGEALAASCAGERFFLFLFLLGGL